MNVLDQIKHFIGKILEILITEITIRCSPNPMFSYLYWNTKTQWVYHKFHDFKAVFQNKVHDNSEILKTSKLYFLKNALTGNAAKFNWDTELSDKSYDDVWVRVLEKYGNYHLIVHAYLHDFFSTEKIKFESRLRKTPGQCKFCVSWHSCFKWKLCFYTSVIFYYSWIRQTYQRRLGKQVNENLKFFSLETFISFFEARASNTEVRTLKWITINAKPWSEIKKSFTLMKKTYIICTGHHLLIVCRNFANWIERSNLKKFLL